MAKDPKTEFSNLVYQKLEELADRVTKNWVFEEWYRDGVDWYLAREIVYLATLWLDADNEEDEEILEELKEYTPDDMAEAAYDYVQSMDDFSRLWNGDDSKRAIMQEYLEQPDYQRSKKDEKAGGIN